jgi:hypothetical protein
MRKHGRIDLLADGDGDWSSGNIAGKEGRLAKLSIFGMRFIGAIVAFQPPKNNR